VDYPKVDADTVEDKLLNLILKMNFLDPPVPIEKILS